MSATAKRAARWIVGAALITAPAAAIAQERPGPAGDAFLDPPLLSEPIGTADDADTTARIDAAIRQLLSETMRPLDGGADELTVEALDRLNRQARRAESALALDEARLAQIRTRLEILQLMREATAPSPAAEAAPAPEAPRASAGNRGTPAPAPQRSPEEIAAEQQQASIQFEVASLPSVRHIVGSAGDMRALFVTPDGFQMELGRGAALPSGFIVETIEPGLVTLKGQGSGMIYSVAPGSPAAQATAAPAEAPRAIDLGGLPVQVF